MNLKEQGFRFYCGDGDCTWRKPIVATEDYPHHIDCTDMTDGEFCTFLESGGDQVRAPSRPQLVPAKDAG